MEALLGYLPILLRASLTTLGLAFLAVVVATVIGALGAAGKLSQSPAAREVASIYSTLIRGIPELVLLVLVYFGLQDGLNLITEGLGLGVLVIPQFTAGVLTLGFIYGAYMTETFRGAYLAVPQGQNEAAKALGMNSIQRFWFIIRPQLIRHALPGFANNWQVLIKATAVVGVIGLTDMVGLANDAGKTAREPFVFNLFVLFMYFLFYLASEPTFRVIARFYDYETHS